MKKRLLSLFLALFLICALASCGEYGEFYTEDGILQNTKVTLTVELNSSVAPVTELSFTLREETDFTMSVWAYGKAQEVLEVLEDGEWRMAPTFGSYVREEALYNNAVASTPKHQEHSKTIQFWDATPDEKEDPVRVATFRYLPLTRGEYRLRVRYSFSTDDENAQIPEGQLEAVAYFTVTAE